MATVAVGTASFTLGGAETAAFTWTDAITGLPVTFGVTPTLLFGPCMTVTSGGPGVPFLNGAGAITTSGGTITCASPPTMTVKVTAIGT